MSAIEILKPGALTTVQDLGRRGWQAQGVTVGGAVDALSLRIANMLTGNPEGAAALECSACGPALRFSQSGIVAVTGARVTGVPYARPFVVEAGEVLSLESFDRGFRAYLAVAGGIVAPAVMDSASTDVKAGFGGLEGRPLRTGDQIEIGAPALKPGSFAGNWSVWPELLPGCVRLPAFRALPGPQVEWFSDEAWNYFWNSDYEVTPQSDRMGLRLRGPELQWVKTRELVSEAVAFGSVQVPPDGAPIVLLADRQTIGGYPKIANVISADLPWLAHARPGDPLRFSAVTVKEAQALLVEREKNMATLRVGVREKLGVRGV